MRQSMQRRGLVVQQCSAATVVEEALETAPDMVVLVGDASLDGGREVLRLLASNPSTSVIPVVLVAEDASLDKRLSAFRHGAVAVVQRGASADALGARVESLARELPERPGGVAGELGESTLDELVDLVRRELRSGILSVSPADASVQPLRIVLGPSRPVAEALEQFVGRLKGLVAEAEPLRYEFHEESAGRLQLWGDEEAPETDLAELAGLRILVVDNDSGRADALAQGLRGHDATVVVTDATAQGLARVRGLDPEVVLLDAAGLDGPSFEIVRALRQDMHLRWASLLMLSWDEIWPERRGSPDVPRLASRLALLVAQDRQLSARAKHEEQLDTRLEITGPSRMLRALTAVEGPLHVTCRNPRATVDVDLTAGLVVGASATITSAPGVELAGPAAVAVLMTLSSGRVRVEHRGNPSVANIMSPVDEALAAAAAEPLPAGFAAEPAAHRPGAVPPPPGPVAPAAAERVPTRASFKSTQQWTPPSPRISTKKAGAGALAPPVSPSATAAERGLPAGEAPPADLPQAAAPAAPETRPLGPPPKPGMRPRATLKQTIIGQPLLSTRPTASPLASDHPPETAPPAPQGGALELDLSEDQPTPPVGVTVPSPPSEIIPAEPTGDEEIPGQRRPSTIDLTDSDYEELVPVKPPPPPALPSSVGLEEEEDESLTPTARPPPAVRAPLGAPPLLGGDALPEDVSDAPAFHPFSAEEQPEADAPSAGPQFLPATTDPPMTGAPPVIVGLPPAGPAPEFGPPTPARTAGVMPTVPPGARLSELTGEPQAGRSDRQGPTAVVVGLPEETGEAPAARRGKKWPFAVGGLVVVGAAAAAVLYFVPGLLGPGETGPRTAQPDAGAGAVVVPDPVGEGRDAQVAARDGAPIEPTDGGVGATARPDAGAAASETPSLPADLARLSVDQLVRRGEAAVAANDFATAEQMFVAVLERDRNENHSMAGLAQVYLSRHDAARALELAEGAVHRRPRRAAYRLILGDAHALAGDRDAARAQWRQALQIEPNNAEAIGRLRP